MKYLIAAFVALLFGALTVATPAKASHVVTTGEAAFAAAIWMESNPPFNTKIYSQVDGCAMAAPPWHQSLATCSLTYGGMNGFIGTSAFVSSPFSYSGTPDGNGTCSSYVYYLAHWGVARTNQTAFCQF